MRDSQQFALQTAKEITIAALQNCKEQVSCNLGENAAQYFETVYQKVLELAKD